MIDTRILNCIYIVLALGALFGALLLRTPAPNHSARVISGATVIPVTIADTPRLRERGLSGTPSLAVGTGKLFIFDRADSYGFWMKDMHYALDIVWIDATNTVVGIAEAVTPESYPRAVYAPAPVLYVLEINAYEAVVDNITVGTVVKIEK
jgi:uncharacterized protein